MRARIMSDFKQGTEYIWADRIRGNERTQAYSRLTSDDILEGVYRAIVFVHVVQPRDLDEPSYIVREQLVAYNPTGKLVPLVGIAPVDAHAPFRILQRVSTSHGKHCICDTWYLLCSRSVMTSVPPVGDWQQEAPDMVTHLV